MRGRLPDADKKIVMKPLRTPLLLGSLLSLSSLLAQEGPSDSETLSRVVPDATDKAEIIGEIPDGSPQEPAPPKPRIVFEAEDVLQSRSVALGERWVTFQKVKPLGLPPLPEPQAIDRESAVSPFDLEDRKERKFVFVGATAYQTSDDARPRSFVRFWPTPGGEAVSLWMNANMLYMTGFADYETETTRYSLLMAITPVHVDLMKKWAARSGREYQEPEPPEFPDENKTSIVIVGGNPTEEELAPIRALASLYDTDKDRLKAAYMNRKQQAEEQARIERENPSEKKNIVLRYWRLDEAGQVGAQAKPATIR